MQLQAGNWIAWAARPSPRGGSHPQQRRAWNARRYQPEKRQLQEHHLVSLIAVGCPVTAARGAKHCKAVACFQLHRSG